MKLSLTHIAPLIKGLGRRRKDAFIAQCQYLYPKWHSEIDSLVTAISSLKTVNNETVQAFLKKTNPTSNYETIKDKLREALIAFLANDFFEATVHGEIQTLLAFERHTSETKYFEISTNTLDRAKELAEEMDYHYLHLAILDRQIFIARNTRKPDTREKIIRLNKDKNQVLNTIAMEIEYSQLSENLFLQLYDKVDKYPPAYYDTINSPYIKTPELATTKAARRQYHIIMALVYQLENKQDKVLECRKNQLAVIEEYPNASQEFFDSYMGALNGLGNALIIEGKFEEVNTLVIQKIESHYGGDYRIPQVFSVKFGLLSTMALRTLQPALLTNKENDFIAGIVSLESRLSPDYVIPMYYNMAISWFLQENYNKTLFWLNRILQFPKTDSRADLRNFVRIFKLIIYLEKEDPEIITSVVRAETRNDKIEAKKNTVENLIIAHISSLTTFWNNSKQTASNIEILSHFLAEMNSLTKEQTSGINYFDEIRYWIMARLETKSVLEIARREEV